MKDSAKAAAAREQWEAHSGELFGWALHACRRVPRHEREERAADTLATAWEYYCDRRRADGAAGIRQCVNLAARTVCRHARPAEDRIDAEPAAAPSGDLERLARVIERLPYRYRELATHCALSVGGVPTLEELANRCGLSAPSQAMRMLRRLRQLPAAQDLLMAVVFEPLAS